MQFKLRVLDVSLLFSVDFLEQMHPEVLVDLDSVLRKPVHIIVLEGGFELHSCYHPIFINVKLLKGSMEINFGKKFRTTSCCSHELIEINLAVTIGVYQAENGLPVWDLAKLLGEAAFSGLEASSKLLWLEEAILVLIQLFEYSCHLCYLILL